VPLTAAGTELKNGSVNSSRISIFNGPAEDDTVHSGGSESDSDENFKDDHVESEDSFEDDDNYQLMTQLGGFNISLKDITIESGILFLTKFTRVFK